MLLLFSCLLKQFLSYNSPEDRLQPSATQYKITEGNQCRRVRRIAQVDISVTPPPSQQVKL